jgi:hypothetical protein
VNKRGKITANFIRACSNLVSGLTPVCLPKVFVLNRLICGEHIIILIKFAVRIYDLSRKWLLVTLKRKGGKKEKSTLVSLTRKLCWSFSRTFRTPPILRSVLLQTMSIRVFTVWTFRFERFIFKCAIATFKTAPDGQWSFFFIQAPDESVVFAIRTFMYRHRFRVMVIAYNGSVLGKVGLFSDIIVALFFLARVIRIN